VGDCVYVGMKKSIPTLAVLLLGLIGMSAAPTLVSADGARLRLGVEAGAGFFPKEDFGVSVPVYPHVGVQFNDFAALYVIPGLTINGLTARAEEPFRDTHMQFNGIGLFDVTIASGLQIGVGGGVDVGKFSGCFDGSDQGCRIEKDTRGAIHGRLALTPGFRLGRSRFGFPIAAHYHASFIDKSPVHQLLFTLGIQLF